MGVCARLLLCERLFLMLLLSVRSVPFSCSVISDSLRPDPMDCSSPGLPVHHQVLKLAQTHVRQVSDAIQASHPLSSPSPPPSIFPSIRVFSNGSVLHIRWPKYWSFSFKISLSNEYSGLISFRIDWFDLLAVQVTQEFSPTPQLKSINSSELSFLYGPSLTSMHGLLAKA